MVITNVIVIIQKQEKTGHHRLTKVKLEVQTVHKFVFEPLRLVNLINSSFKLNLIQFLEVVVGDFPQKPSKTVTSQLHGITMCQMDPYIKQVGTAGVLFHCRVMWHI